MNFSGFWDKPENQRKFLDEVAIKLNVKEPKDWYNVKSKDIKKLGGFTLIHRYYGSMVDMLLALYPEHNLKQWKFEKVSKGFWEKTENQFDFLETTAKVLLPRYLSNCYQEMELKELDDWYKVSFDKFVEMGGYPLLLLFNKSLPNILMNFYPNHNWKPWKFEKVPKGK